MRTALWRLSGKSSAKAIRSTECSLRLHRPFSPVIASTFPITGIIWVHGPSSRKTGFEAGRPLLQDHYEMVSDMRTSFGLHRKPAPAAYGRVPSESSTAHRIRALRSSCRAACNPSVRATSSRSIKPQAPSATAASPIASRRPAESGGGCGARKQITGGRKATSPSAWRKSNIRDWSKRTLHATTSISVLIRRNASSMVNAAVTRAISPTAARTSATAGRVPAANTRKGSARRSMCKPRRYTTAFSSAHPYFCDGAPGRGSGCGGCGDGGCAGPGTGSGGMGLCGAGCVGYVALPLPTANAPTVDAGLTVFIAAPFG